MTTTGEVLKPCPWCPSAEQNLSSNGCDNHMVVCECGAEGPAADTPNLAVAAWNRRAPQGNAAQEGYVLVPVEPTDEMVDAAWDSDGADYVGERKYIHRSDLAYKAMIEVAQQDKGKEAV